MSIFGIIEASKAFSFGTNIRLNHLFAAPITAGRTHQIFLNFPSRASSHKNILSPNNSDSSIYQALSKIPSAIERSKQGPVFLISAGARFTVIRLVGSFVLQDFIALLRRSLLS
jgi:hypothetical protein